DNAFNGMESPLFSKLLGGCARRRATGRTARCRSRLWARRLSPTVRPVSKELTVNFNRRVWAAGAGALCVVAALGGVRAQRPGGGGGARRGGGLAAMALMQALDADGDGDLSAKEIENATAALRAIDKDKDGKVTRQELSGALSPLRARTPRSSNE